MDLTKGLGPPLGRFAWWYKQNGWELPHLTEFVEKIVDQADDSGLLKAGFFSKSVERFEELVKAYKDWLKKTTMSWS